LSKRKRKGKSKSKSESKSKKVRVGMIGCGGISGLHITNLKNIPGVEVIAACDINEEAAEAAAKQHEIPHVFTDYKKLLKLKEIDAVSICTPNFFHAEPAIAAARAGKHVMVEKPMAMTAKEAQAMVDASKKARKVLVVGFQYRYDPKTRLLKRAIDAGEFGKILYVRCQAMRRRGIPNWGVFGRKELQGGGPLIDIGVHIMETAHYLMGKPQPVAASGNCYTYIGDKKSDIESSWSDWDYKTYTVEDLAIGMIRFANGATMLVESSFCAHIEGNVFDITLMGEKGGAKWGSSKIFTDWNGTMVNMEANYVPNDSHWDHKMSDWIESIRTGKKPICPGEDGLAIQKMLDGIYKSAEAGKEIAIK